MLSPQKIELILQAAKDKGDRQLQYAKLSMKCGATCLISCLTLFTVLVILGHDKAAGIIISTTVFGVIGKIVLARLE